ncbi:MAG TPA: helix-turn-helix domain-containing protein [Lachnospiraceae bacterium]|nr:helix-turn-helix domain-containing protein [Lachnospiraceae bacterium]
MRFRETLCKAQRGEVTVIQQILEMFRPMLIRNALVNSQFNKDLYQELSLEALKCIHNFRITM